MYRILLVEDDATLCFIYSKMKVWTECGFTIAAEASDGKKALEMLKKDSYDLIFTDIKMPFVDGIEMLKILAKEGNTIPVIFASSYDEFEYARQGLILGAFDYLLKPVDQKKLTDVLLRAKKHIEETKAATKFNPLVISVLEEIGVSPDDNNFISSFAEYCSAHYEEDLMIDDFASAHGYSKDYFGKMFKQHFKITFREFSSRIKVARAIELLRTGNYKAYEISDILGYSSVDYFTKVFKEITGTTPLKYKFGVEENK